MSIPDTDTSGIQRVARQFESTRVREACCECSPSKVSKVAFALFLICAITVAAVALSMDFNSTVQIVCGSVGTVGGLALLVSAAALVQHYCRAGSGAIYLTEWRLPPGAPGSEYYYRGD